MDVACSKFVEDLMKMTPGLKAIYCETLDYWSPEEPPITTLFAALGDQIVDDFDEVEADLNRCVFNLIESAMGGQDEVLVTAVATGLIEAVVTKALPREELWKRISLVFGDLSRKHAEAWGSGE